MDLIETLTKKVHLAAEQLTKVKKEKEKLETELKYLQEESRRAQEIVRENEVLKGRQKQAAQRIEKLLKKLV